ncbi:MAG: hypothetical protein ACC662_08625, partial [Planctomycetota bacterium]
AERTVAVPGDAIAIAVRVTLPEGWHANGNEVADEALIPTVLALASREAAPPDAAWRLEEIRYPSAFAGASWIRAALRVPTSTPPGPVPVEIALRLQPCRETACQAERTLRLLLDLEVAEQHGPLRHPTLPR